MYDTKSLTAKNKLSEVVSKFIKLERNGTEFKGCCPFHKEKTPSFTLSDSKGQYYCFGCGASGDVIDFIKNYKELSFKEACDYLGGEIINDGKAPEKKIIEEDDTYKGLTPTGKFEYDIKAGEKTTAIWQPKRKEFIHYNPTYAHIYRNANGVPIGAMLRLDLEHSKIMLPVQEVERGAETILAVMPFKEPRPLYGIESIREDGTGYVVEGEKTKDAFYNINDRKAQVITWQGGANGVSKADWASLPKGKNWILIPDADYKCDPKTGELLPMEEQVGYKAMIEVSKLLPEPLSVRIVITHEMGKEKDGWDVADAQNDGWDAATLINFIKENIKVLKSIAKKNDDIALDDSEHADIEVKVDKYSRLLDYDDTYFRCLGFSGKNHFFYHKATGQVWSFQGKELSFKSNLLMLAPSLFWASLFPKGKSHTEADYDSVADWLLRINEKVGFYSNNKIRNRGAWIDEGRTIIHLGDRIVHGKKHYPLEDFESDYIYPKKETLGLDYGTYMPKEASARLIDIFRKARWEKEYYGDMLAGWVFASLVCGALKYRSHLYLIGASGSGKSWVMENFIRRVMGNLPLYCVSSTSEAGIRKALDGDVRPVIFNEAEAEDKTAQARLQEVFTLARQATDEDSFNILKGSGTGESYSVRSTFIWGSINKSITRFADKNRTPLITLRVPSPRATKEELRRDAEQFKSLERIVDATLNREYASCLLGRAVSLIPVIRENQKIFAEVGARVYGNRRLGDTMSMFLTGIYNLENDGVATEKEAVAYCKRIKFNEDSADDVATQEMSALDHLLFSEISVEDSSFHVRRIRVAKAIYLLSKANANEFMDIGFKYEQLKSQLEDMGLKVERADPKNNIEGRVFFATKDECICAKAFKDSIWESGWREAILRNEGMTKTSCKFFSKTLKTSAIVGMIDFIQPEQAVAK